MDINQLFKGLTDQQKKELKEAKTKEELDALVTSAGMELSEDQLSSVSGGCFDPATGQCDKCIYYECLGYECIVYCPEVEACTDNCI